MNIKPPTPSRRAGAALALTLALASPGIAHAAFPGENGVIVYQVGESLWKLPADGSGSATPIAGRLVHPAVSPNGKKLAAVTRGSYPDSLVVSNLDGSDRVVIEDNVRWDAYPAWSPDGKTLALLLFSGEIVLYDVATKKEEYLVNLNWNYTYGAYRVRWSPLGDKLVAETLTESWVVDVASKTMTELPFFKGADWWPDTSGVLLGQSTSEDPSCFVFRYPNGATPAGLPICDKRLMAVAPDGTKLLTGLYLSTGSPTPIYKLFAQDLKGNVLQTMVERADAAADWARVPKTAMRTTLGKPGEWTAPVPLADDADSYTSQSAIAVMPDSGSLGGALRRALGIGTDGRVYERAQLTNGNWGAWVLVPGPGKTVAGIAAKQVAIAGALDGSLQAVIVGSDDIVYHAMRYANGSWSGFAQVNGANGAANFAARDVAIAIVNSSLSTPGQAHVVANGLGGGTVYHRVRLDDGNWTPWGAPGGPATNAVAVAFAGNKDLYLVGTTTSGGITRTVRRASGAWDSCVSVSDLPAGGFKDVAVSIDSDPFTGNAKLAYLAYVGNDNQVWSQARLNPAGASSWTGEPAWSSPVMPNGRSVSMAMRGSLLELLAVQAQPQ